VGATDVVVVRVTDVGVVRTIVVGVVFGIVVVGVVFGIVVVGVVIRVLPVDVGVVVPPPDVVVVVLLACEHTLIVTVWGKGGLSTVPADGFWVWTVPGVPPVCEQSTMVNTDVSPGVAVMAAPAEPWVSLTTLGTVAEHGPFEMTRLIGVAGCTCVPAVGVWEATLLAETCCEHADVCVPTVRLSPEMVLPADVWEKPTTLGTLTED
jgi:hypothetical protein